CFGQHSVGRLDGFPAGRERRLPARHGMGEPVQMADDVVAMNHIDLPFSHLALNRRPIRERRGAAVASVIVSTQTVLFLLARPCQIMRAGMHFAAKRQARERVKEAVRSADRAETEAWSIRMEGYSGPTQPSPMIDQCL